MGSRLARRPMAEPTHKRPENRRSRPMPRNVHRGQATNDPVADTPPVRSVERVRLSWDVAADLVLYGVLLIGLSLTAQHLQQAFPRLTFFTGLVGGGLCVLWGILGRRGTRCRVAAMMTLAAVACVLARQAVQSWATSTEGGSKVRMVATMMTVLVVLCVGVLANLVREGEHPQP